MSDQTYTPIGILAQLQPLAEGHLSELAAIIEYLPTGIFVTDESGVVLANRFGYEMLGYSVANGLPIPRVTLEDIDQRLYVRWATTGEVAPRSQRPTARALAGEVSTTEVIMRSNTHDEDRVVEYAAVPILNEGRPDGALVMLSDITERWQAQQERDTIEAERKERELILSAVLGAAQLATRVYDIATDTLRLSPQATAMLGRDAATIQTLAEWLATVHPDDRLMLQEATEKLLSGEQDRCFVEHRSLWEDGTVCWIALYAEVERDNETGLPRRIIGGMNDITERKTAEQQVVALNRKLSEQVAEMEAIMEVTPVMLYVAEDPECRTIRSNRMGQEMLLAPPDSRNLSKSAPDSERPDYFQTLRDGQVIPPDELPIQVAAATGQVVRAAELDIIRSDGSTFRMYGNAAPLWDAEGHVRGAVGAFLDITPRYQQLEQQTRVAAALQRSLLLTPPADRFPDLNLATRYEAAWEEAQVGGDFYDTFTYWDNLVVIVLGDVTGKGLEAATHTAEVKFALRAFMHQVRDPALALSRLNRFLYDSANSTVNGKGANTNDTYDFMTFVSLAVVLINVQTGETWFAAGGAEPSLILRADTGLVEEVSASGMVLGAFPDAEYQTVRRVLNPGDLLLMTTDGLTEARNPQKEFFGIDGVAQTLQEVTGANLPPLQLPTTAATLETVANDLLERARGFGSGQLHDDVCLLLAQRTHPNSVKAPIVSQVPSVRQRVSTTNIGVSVTTMPRELSNLSYGYNADGVDNQA